VAFYSSEKPLHLISVWNFTVVDYLILTPYAGNANYNKELRDQRTFISEVCDQSEQPNEAINQRRLMEVGLNLVQQSVSCSRF
jgi:hypothetical protein